jgi:hypothetical protein
VSGPTAEPAPRYAMIQGPAGPQRVKLNLKVHCCTRRGWRRVAECDSLATALELLADPVALAPCVARFRVLHGPDVLHDTDPAGPALW